MRMLISAIIFASIVSCRGSHSHLPAAPEDDYYTDDPAAICDTLYTQQKTALPVPCYCYETNRWIQEPGLFARAVRRCAVADTLGDPDHFELVPADPDWIQ